MRARRVGLFVLLGTAVLFQRVSAAETILGADLSLAVPITLGGASRNPGPGVTGRLGHAFSVRDKLTLGPEAVIYLSDPEDRGPKGVPPDDSEPSGR